MDNNAFEFIQAVFHVLVFIVVHGRTRQGLNGCRKSKKPARRRREIQRDLLKIADQKLKRKEFHETRSSLSKPVALSKEL
jgi:hypothetical protein